MEPEKLQAYHVVNQDLSNAGVKYWRLQFSTSRRKFFNIISRLARDCSKLSGKQ